MYYEEKIINGVLCHRSTPDGEWIPFNDREIIAMQNKAKALGCESCKYVLKVNLRAGNPCCGKHEWPDIEEKPENGTGVYVPYKCNDYATTGADKMTIKEIKTQVNMQKIHNARTKQAMNNLDNNEKLLARYGGM